MLLRLPFIVVVLVGISLPGTSAESGEPAFRPCPHLDLRQWVLGEGDLSPLDLPLSQCTLSGGIPVLNALSREDLRLVRNAIYARRGRRFKAKDLSEFFARFSWYTAEAESVDDKLTQLDRENVRALLAAEKRKRTPLPPRHLGVVDEVRNLNPSDDDDIYLLLKGGEARLVWKNPNDERHQSTRLGHWELDWPHLFIWWTSTSGTRGVGEPVREIPEGQTPGNAPDVYRDVIPFQRELKSTTVIDWKETESMAVERAARFAGLNVEAFRVRIDSRGRIARDAWRGDPVYGQFSFETGGEVKCSAVACRLPSGEPCVPCAK